MSSWQNPNPHMQKIKIYKNPKLNLNDRVREDLERANRSYKRKDDFFVAMEDIWKGFVDLGLNLEPSNLDEVDNEVGQRENGVEKEQEKGVVAIENVIGFFSRVIEP